MSDWRERARTQYGDQVDAEMAAYFAEEPLTPDEFDTQMRTNQLEAFRALDPHAHLDEELTMRLVSDSIPDGMLLVGIADPIVRRLQEMIDSLAKAKVQLGLTALSPGSTVLHLKPVYGAPAAPSSADDDSLPADADASSPSENLRASVDRAMQDVIAVIAAAESGEELDAPTGVLAAFDKLVTTLDKISVDVDFGWHASSGTVKRGRLTTAGRRHTQRQMQPRTSSSLRTVSGYISALSAPKGKGRITIRPSILKGSGLLIHIDAEEMTRLHLAFGEWVSIVVERTEHLEPLSGVVTCRDTFRELRDRREEEAEAAAQVGASSEA